jgi:hypothetical protein
MPPTETAVIVLINGDTCSAEYVSIDPPGTNLDEVEKDFLDEGDEKLVTAYTSW